MRRAEPVELHLGTPYLVTVGLEDEVVWSRVLKPCGHGVSGSELPLPGVVSVQGAGEHDVSDLGGTLGERAWVVVVVERLRVSREGPRGLYQHEVIDHRIERLE